MPIYGFHCTGCAKEFETLVRASDADEVACPSCGSAHVEQMLARIAKPSAGAEDAGASSAGHACSTPSGCMGGGCG